MLLRVLFLCGAVVVLGETLLQAAASLAVSALQHRGATAAAHAFADAEQLAQATIAAAMAAGATPPASLPPTQTCVTSDAAGCTMSARTRVTLATPVPTPCPSAGCNTYLQENDAVDEGRIVASIATTIALRSGAPIAARDGSVLFRTLRAPPYAVASGALDGTLDDSESGAGDTAGLIQVVYQDAVSGATMPANVWSGMSPAAPSASGWSP
ncbi:MAG TPA: hypothetical protein VMV82_01890 [Candidatus Dormibacteraeota bacterium]|nr:hypothetical protein [Candidatus Dormibacteraeota bacterium]